MPASANRLMRFLFLISALLFCSTIDAAKNPPGHIELIELPITVRVDTTDTDVRAVYDLVRKFLSTRPDSLYDNPYWNEDEKKKYAEPYPARRMIFETPDIIKAFPPKVLSIEKEGDYYCIRLLFYREGLEPPYQTSNPWAIIRLYSRKVDIENSNSEYRLFDPLKITTNNWRYSRVGLIDYYYPLDYSFNRRTAENMVKFCRALKNKYELPEIQTIEFYVAPSVDRLAHTVGIDYLLGATSGRALTANAQVFSSYGSEWYPHEITHLYFRDFKSHFLLMEGIATYEGGSMNISFDSLVKTLDNYFETNDTITFQNILDNPFLEKGTLYYYTVGAVLCKMADQKGGPEAVKSLLEAGHDNEHLYQKIESVLGIKREELTNVIREKVKEYANR